MELGLYTFAEASAEISGAERLRQLLEEIVLADQLGIEVFGMMDGRVNLVLDGGLCPGAGSTTIDITEPYWRVIKRGAIDEREIAEVLKGR